jgi:hypothetical protein
MELLLHDLPVCVVIENSAEASNFTSLSHDVVIRGLVFNNQVPGA